MKQPLLVRSAAARAPSLPTPWADHSAPRALSLAARLLPWAALGAILAGALFLRLFRLDGFTSFYPDTYGQLRAADNLVSGQFPITYLYPPGIAVFLAPVFAFLPRTILTLQATILVAGTALVVLAYAATLATTGDRRAAFFHAAAVALGATFVFHSRVALFDVINTLLIAVALLLAPVVVRRGSAVLLAYGLLVFVTITVRYTNPVILPALFLASMRLETHPLSRRLLWGHLRSRTVITVGLVVLALSGAYVVTMYESLTRFSNPQAGSVIEFSHYLPRLAQYLQASFIGYGETLQWQNGLAAAAILPFAIVGARRLWMTNRSFAVPLFFLIITWAPVHAVYMIFWGRYAMPVFFFLLMLAALGVSVSLNRFRSLQHTWQRVGLAGLTALAVTFFVGQQLAQDITLLYQPPGAAQRSEAAYEDIRIVLRTLDGPDSALVSAQVLAVDKANPAMASYDLLRHSETYGINDDSIDRLLEYVRAQQADGKTVYYHYTGYEDKRSRLHKYEQGFDTYFSALQREFSVRELFRSSGHSQRLYALEPPISDASQK